MSEDVQCDGHTDDAHAETGQDDPDETRTQDRCPIDLEHAAAQPNGCALGRRISHQSASAPPVKYARRSYGETSPKPARRRRVVSHQLQTWLCLADKNLQGLGGWNASGEWIPHPYIDTEKADVDDLDTPQEIRSAVCNTGDQLRRHLATLALNIAAGLVSPDTELVGEDFNTVGDALTKAIALLDSGDRSERNRIKDIIEDINENRNTDTDCSPTYDDDDDSDDRPDDRDDDDPPTGSTCSGVEIPPGQFPPPGKCKIWDPRLPPGQ